MVTIASSEFLGGGTPIAVNTCRQEILAMVPALTLGQQRTESKYSWQAVTPSSTVKSIELFFTEVTLTVVVDREANSSSSGVHATCKPLAKICTRTHP